MTDLDFKVKRCAEVDLRHSFWCSKGPSALPGHWLLLQRECPVEYNYIKHEYIHSTMCVYVYITFVHIYFFLSSL